MQKKNLSPREGIFTSESRLLPQPERGGGVSPPSQSTTINARREPKHPRYASQTPQAPQKKHADGSMNRFRRSNGTGFCSPNASGRKKFVVFVPRSLQGRKRSWVFAPCRLQGRKRSRFLPLAACKDGKGRGFCSLQPARTEKVGGFAPRSLQGRKRSRVLPLAARKDKKGRGFCSTQSARTKKVAVFAPRSLQGREKFAVFFPSQPTRVKMVHGLFPLQPLLEATL
jgi:hypothetical protein